MNDDDLRMELLELESVRSQYEMCPKDVRERLGLFLEDVDGALVMGATSEPSILINRAIGVGVHVPASAKSIERIVSIYRERGIGRFFLPVYPDMIEGGQATLEAAGLTRARGWVKFYRGMDPAPEPTTDLTVRRVGEAEADVFGRITAGAFGMTDAAGAMLASLVRDSRWHLFMSYDGEIPAGAGGLLIIDNDALIEFGATAAEFRRRGSQGAIMHERIEAARAAGCSRIFVETGEAVAGDAQASYGNIERFGFEAQGLRENWAPA